MVGFPRKTINEDQNAMGGYHITKVIVHKDTLPKLGIHFTPDPYDEEFMQPMYYWVDLETDAVYACVFQDSSSRQILVGRYLMKDISILPELKLLSKLHNNEAIIILLKSSRELDQGQ